MASIAVIGGTGDLGRGIVRRLAKAGHDVTIGSRSAEKAKAAADEMAADTGPLGHAANEDAARGKDIVIVTVPYASQAGTLELIREMYPKAHFATVYAKPKGKPMVQSYVTEVSQDTWIFFPWDMALQYVRPYRGDD